MLWFNIKKYGMTRKHLKTRSNIGCRKDTFYKKRRYFGCMGCYVDSMADGISRWRMPGRPPVWDSPRERVPKPSLQAGRALTPAKQ
jgi:hypothetical protein